MSSNPYAPPTADVEDVSVLEASPPLWNPSAAARWSLLFSPIFGATVQMHNWIALGEPEKAAASRRWAISNLVVILGLGFLSAFLPDTKAIDLGLRMAGLGLLIAWYIVSSRPQTNYIAARFGTAYPKKGWAKPLLYALLSLFAFVAAFLGVALAFDAVFGPG